MRKRNGKQPPEAHDWHMRAKEALDLAQKMAPGTDRDAAIRKAKEFAVAADMRGYLASSELKSPR